MEKNEGIEKPFKFLKKPLNISELTGAGAQFDFEVDFDDNVAAGFDELNLGFDDENGCDETLKKFDASSGPSPWELSFAELKEQMHEINVYLHKSVMNKASKEKKEKGLVPDNARVTIRYSAYWEGEGVPFDSTILRGTAFTFITGQCEVLEGLECAVRTMYEGETAKFLISYKLLFLELGCPPRIKPRADGLFIIELLNYNLAGDVDAVESVSEEDQTKFSVVVDKAKKLHLKGLDYFKQGFYKNAIHAFQRCIEALTFSQLANEEEKNEKTMFLIKLHTNLAVCYNKIDAPSKTCFTVREIKNLTNNKPSCKVAFLEGRALLMQGDYEPARECLKRALEMEPDNAEISKELCTLDLRFSKYKKTEREIWSKAFGVVNKVKEVDVMSEEKSRLKADYTKLFQEFKDNKQLTHMEVPEIMLSSGIDFLTELCESMDITLNRSYLNQNGYMIFKNNAKN